jgi:CheY-like chemotaxis protein
MGFAGSPASARHPIRVVAVTGLGRDDDLRRIQAAGFDGHVVKRPTEATPCIQL